MECHLKKYYYQSASYHKRSQAARPERYCQTNDHLEPIFDVPLNDMLITRTLLKEKRWRHSTSIMLNKTKMFRLKTLGRIHFPFRVRLSSNGGFLFFYISIPFVKN